MKGVKTKMVDIQKFKPGDYVKIETIAGDVVTGVISDTNTALKIKDKNNGFEPVEILQNEIETITHVNTYLDGNLTCEVEDIVDDLRGIVWYINSLINHLERE